MIPRIALLLMIVTHFSHCSVAQLPRLAQPSGITEQEAAGGIKEALANGITNAILNLNRQDGFFGSALYKILLPPDAVRLERTLRNLGMGAQVDKAILQINRAAEDAVGFAKPIFVEAIQQMTLADAIGLVRGGRTSGTDYFRNKTRAQLIAAFTPSVKASLDKLEATKYYTDLVNTYNKIPTVRQKLNPDLTGYVVEKATDALFDQIAQEEIRIRENPAARTTDLLKKVFGSRL